MGPCTVTVKVAVLSVSFTEISPIDTTASSSRIVKVSLEVPIVACTGLVMVKVKVLSALSIELSVRGTGIVTSGEPATIVAVPEVELYSTPALAVPSLVA